MATFTVRSSRLRENDTLRFVVVTILVPPLRITLPSTLTRASILDTTTRVDIAK